MLKQSSNRAAKRGSVLSTTVALVLISAISFFGVKTYQQSHAANGASIYLTPASSQVSAGTNVSVTVRENSGSQAVNSVQASINYDSNQLQFISISEGKGFPVVAANSTGTPGVVRIGRGTTSTMPQAGDQPVVTLTFKAIGSGGAANLSLDKNYSFLVSSADSQDILQAVGAASVSVVPGKTTTTSTTVPGSGVAASPTSGGSPVLYISPSTGSIAEGATLSTQVRLNAFNNAVTTVEAVINYPTDKLRFVNVNEGGTFSTQQRTKNGSGSVDIIRAVPGGSDGVTGDKAVATINFKVISGSGTASLGLLEGSSAFDKSGTGTNILDLGASAGASFTLAAAGTATPPLTIITQNGGNPETSSTITSQSQAVRLKSGAGGNAALAKDDTGAGVTELSGKVELSPVTTSANASGSAIARVEYYLGKKLISSQNTAPYAYTFDSTATKNGTYNITVKTYYADGTVDTKSDKLLVSNDFTLAYVLRHYGVAIVISIVILAALVFLLWKIVLPRLNARHQAALAKAADHDVMYGYSDPTAAQALVAADPTLVAPSAPVAPISPVAISEPPVTQPSLADSQTPAHITPAIPTVQSAPIAQPSPAASEPVLSPSIINPQLSPAPAAAIHQGPMASVRPIGPTSSGTPAA